MEFNLIRPDKLKVLLTRQDLESLGVSWEQLDYSDENTRRALVSLLEQGKIQTGFSPRMAKLYIEVFPSEGEGCVIYYTRLAGGEAFPSGKFVPGPAPVVFAFPDAEALIEACSRTLRQYGHRIYKSSLFKMEKGYRLIILPLDYTDRLSVYFLNEFGDLIGEGAVVAAFTEEHGILLRMDDAIEALAGCGD